MTCFAACNVALSGNNHFVERAHSTKIVVERKIVFMRNNKCNCTWTLHKEITNKNFVPFVIFVVQP
jgi:hypothetical protein